jgi:hypothetical protein
MSGKFKNEIEITISFDNLINENANVVIELTLLPTSKMKLLGFWIISFPF